MKTIKPSHESRIIIKETFTPAKNYEEFNAFVEHGAIRDKDSLFIFQQPQLICAYVANQQMVRVEIKDEKKLLCEIQNLLKPKLGVASMLETQYPGEVFPQDRQSILEHLNLSGVSISFKEKEKLQKKEKLSSYLHLSTTLKPQEKIDVPEKSELHKEQIDVPGTKSKSQINK